MSQRVEALERELAAAGRELEHAWGSYHALRRRRAVRAALRVAGLRAVLADALRAVRGRADRVVVDGDAGPVAAVAPPPSAEGDPPVGGAPGAAAEPAADRAVAEPVAAQADASGVDAAVETVAHVWPLGHFYSPVPDTVALRREPVRSRIWPATPRETVGIDWRADAQVALLRELQRLDPLPFPDAPTGDPTEYHTANPNFSALDAWTLQAMLRHLRPRRVIEVGSGWSSLVTARVNRECLGGAVDVTCIEPYPPDFLTAGAVDGIARLVVSPVQDVPVARFRELEAGDVLFIDTAHVIKTGGDVQYLFHEVIPRVRPGVVIHVHDIFLPWEYPQEWVLGGRGWNEQYLLQSFLSFNDAFEVVLGVAWLAHHHRELLVAGLPGGAAAMGDGGGSFWMRRTR